MWQLLKVFTSNNDYPWNYKNDTMREVKNLHAVRDIFRFVCVA